MNGMNPFSTDQWIQRYPNTAMARSGGEPTDVTTTTVHKDSRQSGAKLIRRRSRASRRTPTTLLNASPNDFRALVQRFTGCDSGVKMASDSIANLPKGPVNITFERNDMNESSSRYKYYDNQVRSPQQAQQMQSVGGLSDLQAEYSLENTFESSLLASTKRNGGSHDYSV